MPLRDWRDHSMSKYTWLNKHEDQSSDSSTDIEVGLDIHSSNEESVT